ncbi:MAG: Imm30 family immunity protein [Hyphomonas sp.]|nr:Imm30 family immunity protein [Hyphomonas sp.]
MHQNRIELLAELDNALKAADDNSKFLKALDEIEDAQDASVVPHLLQLLDDRHEHQDWMWSIVHTAEGLGLSGNVYVHHLASRLPKVATQSPHWGSTLLIRVLNHAPSFGQFIRLAPSLPETDRTIIRDLLRSIITDDPQRFQKSGSSLLSAFAT